MDYERGIFYDVLAMNYYGAVVVSFIPTCRGLTCTPAPLRSYAGFGISI
jgi:hypothetical protein